MILLSKMVRQNRIKVVVTGEGSDEFLAGYDIFKEAMIRRFWASQPDSRLRPLLLKRLYQYIPQIADADVSVLRMFFSYRLGDTGNPFYSHLLRWNGSNQIRKHLAQAVVAETSDYSALDTLKASLPTEFESWDPLAKAQWLEATIFMSGYLLSSQGDRMGMANSVEGRYPFLDYRLIEFCNSLPPKFKLKGVTEKYLLKKLLRDRIPEPILKRTKQPYRAPVNNAFLGKNAPDYAREMLSQEQTEKVNVFDYNKLKPVLTRINRAGSASEMDDMLLASVISTHLLFEQFIEGRNSNYEAEEQKIVRITEDSIPVLT
jgi:asparagine synthase (glutamine-hydrolysing)